MNRNLSLYLRRSIVTAALLVLFGALSVVSAHAQAFPPPAYGYGSQGGNPYQQGLPGQQGFPGQRAYPGQRGTANSGRVLPDGIDALYALEGVNALALFGTKDGYDTALEVVRNIDGDLDIVRTQITLVKTTRADLTGLGVTLTSDALTDSDIAKLVAARQAGKLRAADAVRITTREDTVVDALLGEHQRGEVPLTIVPRVTDEGLVAVELLQPVSTTVTSASRQTTVALLPGSGTADASPVTLLFVTPTILPSEYRPAR